MQHIKKLLLPRIPEHFIPEIYSTIDRGRNITYDGPNIIYKEKFEKYYGWYLMPESLQQWFRQNISPDIYFGIQVITEQMPIHKDVGADPKSRTELKFNYLIDTGGNNVRTCYYDQEENLTATYVLEPHVWYMLNVRELHAVYDLSPRQRRVSITGRILPD